MEEMYGYFGRFLRRNEKTGESKFTVIIREQAKAIVCVGIIQSYPHHTPLYLKGEYESDKEFSVFNISLARACGYDRDIMLMFLSSDEFPDIGPSAAGKILNATSVDIFNYLRLNPSISSIVQKVDIPEAPLRRALNKLLSCVEFETLYRDIVTYGGNYYNAAAIYAKYGSDSNKVILKNPYVLLYTDIPLEACEKMAELIGMEHCDKKRVHALVEHCMIQNSHNGNTRIAFKELCRMIRRAEDKAGGRYRTHPLFIGEEILSGDYFVDETDAVYIYRKEDREAEISIASNITRLQKTAVKLTNAPALIDKVEGMCGVKYSEDQRSAFSLLNRSGVKIITGGPGTGKTTLLNGILRKYRIENKHAEIALCAPTGCAARRMSECTGRKATTIHKLLNIRPFESKTGAYSKKLTADMIVVDESSMIDTFIMSRLLSSVKSGALLILLGDKDQLPSVSAGNVFEDILSSGLVETCYLTSVFRQDSRSLIIENSHKVLNGDSRVKCDKTFKIREFSSEADMIVAARNVAAQCIDKEYGFKLYTPSKNRKFASGTIQMNRILQSLYHHGEADHVSYGQYDYMVGDKVLFNRNNYEKGYFNGQEGIIRDIQTHNNTVHVSIETDEGRISLAGLELSDIELAYAMTAHKSQGSECDNAIILIPKEPASLLKNRLLYVEITRARHGVLILCEKGALQAAVGRRGQIIRNTGLRELLKRRCTENNVI